MSYKHTYIVHYWFELRDGNRKKGDIPFEAEDQLSPEFKFENINALIEKKEPGFPDRISGDYFIRPFALLNK
jgi:hypothetical protein